MSRLIAALGRHKLLSAAGLLLIAGAVYLGWDLARVATAPDSPATLGLPEAPRLTAAEGETLYRLDASRSSVTVEVVEQLAGADATARLVTRSLAGDIAVNRAEVGRSRVGDVVVNVEQLSSDNRLRDKAIRLEYLESTRLPYATLRNITVSGASGALRDDLRAEVTLTGELEVRGVRRPATFTGTAAARPGEFTLEAGATVRMSEFGVGPISKAGLVRTQDEVRLTLSLVAVEDARFRLTAPEVEVRTVADPAAAPAFSTAIAPVLAANCASCHKAGAPGAHAWSLQTAGDAAKVAEGLATVTTARFMPPWPASDKSVPFNHVRRLTDAQIADIAAWAAAGGPLDVDASTPVVAEETRAVTIRRDQIVTPEQPYRPTPAKVDDYRCQVFDPKVTDTRAVTAMAFEPDKTEIVHHALLYRYRAEDVARVRAKDAREDGPGFECVAVQVGLGGGDQLATWAPGQDPWVYPEGLGHELRPGDVFVLQIHYHTQHPTEADNSRIVLQFADRGATVTPLAHIALQAPVEIPCPPGTTAPLCDRNAMVADAAERFGPIGGIIPDALHGLCGTSVESVAARSDGVRGTTVCDTISPFTGEVVDVFGHMHDLGASYRMTINPGTPEERIVLDIPTWDYHWQLAYPLKDPLLIRRGDRIRVECNWDRRQRHDPEPRYLLFAEGTKDEMCFSSLTYKPVD